MTCTPEPSYRRGARRAMGDYRQEPPLPDVTQTDDAEEPDEVLEVPERCSYSSTTANPTRAKILVSRTIPGGFTSYWWPT